MGLCRRRPTRVPLLTKRHRQLRIQWALKHRDWTMDEWKRVAWSNESRFLISSSRRWSYHVTPSAWRTVAPFFYSRSYTGWWRRYYALGDVLMGDSRTRSCDRTDLESCELSEHHCGSVAPLHGFCLPIWK
ncbi:hypothetical protein AVEN_59434-1 [Araneus ventricosus]|uniref:Transposase Tc1-like domain-containing protein n=1 Tax=Araneus ventricosus TaxID=182803 RepID=A0A4Y2MF71_ARAVE|nr:hypothetical protein AVEN_59434-1 [Araneus ventricosus]